MHAPAGLSLLACVLTSAWCLGPALAQSPEPADPLQAERFDPEPVELQILIPFYVYPNWYAADPADYLWPELAAANSRVPITAIVNPNSGPARGAIQDDYLIGLAELTAAGVTTLGYVSTVYGTRPLAEVKADVDQYEQGFPGLEGIFFDEASTSLAELAYYEELYAYVHASPLFDRVVLNPGTNTNEAYLSTPAGDTAILFEDVGASWEGYVPDGYVAEYPAAAWSFLAYGVADEASMRGAIDLAVERRVGFVYVTDDTLPNPWDSLPGYWGGLVGYVESING